MKTLFIILTIPIRVCCTLCTWGVVLILCACDPKLVTNYPEEFKEDFKYIFTGKGGPSVGSHL